MSLQNNTNVINLFDDDSDDDLLNPRPPKRKTTTAVVKPPPKKKKTNKGFALLWICTHGKGQTGVWTKKDLKVLGVYPTKALAQAAKDQVMSQHDCCGHGDICVGDFEEDEIDLVIRDTPLYLEE